MAITRTFSRLLGPVSISGGMPGKRFVVAAFMILYACATLQFIRYYVTFTTFYLNLDAYLAGHERLPFQTRVLPATLIKIFQRSPIAHYAVAHDKGAFTPNHAPLLIISLLAMAIAGVYVQALYQRVSKTGALSFLVYPVFLFTMMWTYSIHLEANFSYPYDMPAVAFFGAGLYYIFTHRYWLLLAVMVVGSFNRETTLFLIAIYILDALAVEVPPHGVAHMRSRFSSAQVPWLRAALLCAVWLAIRHVLMHRFAHNDATENHVRIRENIGHLTPRLWPALLNVCGYVLPIVVIFRRNIEPLRFRSYLWVLPLWFAVMFYTGVIVETRVYGELCPYVAVAAILIIEERLARIAAVSTTPYV